MDLSSRSVIGQAIILWITAAEGDQSSDDSSLMTVHDSLLPSVLHHYCKSVWTCLSLEFPERARCFETRLVVAPRPSAKFAAEAFPKICNTFIQECSSVSCNVLDASLNQPHVSSVY